MQIFIFMLIKTSPLNHNKHKHSGLKAPKLTLKCMKPSFPKGKHHFSFKSIQASEVNILAGRQALLLSIIKRRKLS